MWSRVDGETSLGQLVLMTGFERGRAIGILRKLWQAGAFLLPEETPESVADRIAGEAAGEGQVDEPAAAAFSPEEEAALAEEVALGDTEKRRVLEMRRRVAEGDHFAVLDVEPGVTRRELKRAYFRVSKEFHPDRYYGKNVGSFEPWLAEIFEAASRAFETLADARSRAEYEALLRGDHAGAAGSRKSQTPAEEARELYERACAFEVGGDAQQALALFATVARVDPRARYLKRAATCAMTAGELKTAEEYAKQAAHLEPRNPSFLRLLAEVYRAAGKLREAERTLVSALELKTGNDVLAAEIAGDLDAVRKQL